MAERSSYSPAERDEWAPGTTGAAGSTMARERASDKTPADGPGPAIARRRGGGFRQAGGSVRGKVEQVAQTRGFSEPDVLLRWEEIVGAELAAFCRPVTVSYARRYAMGARLLVEADGARALEVEHLAPRIVERVNAHYGYRAISEMKVTQAAGRRGLAEGAAGFDLSGAPGEQGGATPWRGEARDPAPVTPEAARQAKALTRGIRHPALRAALAEMGAYVLSRQAAQDPTDRAETAALTRPTRRQS